MVSRTRRFGFLVAAFCALFVATLALASAKTYDGGKTVWFSDVTIGSGDVVRGNLDVVFGNVTCEDGATIRGSVRTFFGTFDQRDGCGVGGEVVDAFGRDSLDAYVPWPALGRGEAIAQRELVNKFGWDVVIVLAFLLFPVRARIALDRVERHPGLSAATGAVALVAALPIAVLLLLSIIGLPLVPLEIAALFAALWIGYAAVALLIGRRMYELVWPHQTPTPLVALLLGLVVITAAQTLPVVGWAVTALVGLVGLGAAVLAFVRETTFHGLTDGAASASGTAGRPGRPPARPM
ncbi:MAG: hypothetical protein NVSMB21_17840 [Vulcanimicrobiaceae bacterium]